MRLILSSLLLIFCSQLLAQQQMRYFETQRNNDGNILLFNFIYGGHLPGGDLSERFGPNSSAGGMVEILTQNNIIIGSQIDFQWGPEVRTDVLASHRDGDGLIFGDDGGIADIQLRRRGLYVGGHIGKVIPFAGPNTRSGIRVTVGGGFFQHKIRVQDDPQVFVPTLRGDYKKGYDRLTNGFALTEFIGYQYLATNRRINFLAGLEMTQGFTQGRRGFNYDTRTPASGRRLDLLFGFRIGWTLPIYIGENPDEIRY